MPAAAVKKQRIWSRHAQNSSRAKKNEEEKVFVVMLRIGWKGCPWCGDHEVYRSRIEPLTWLDRACVLFLLQLVRCHECESRHYRPLLFPAPEYPRPIFEKCAQTHDEKRKRSE